MLVHVRTSFLAGYTKYNYVVCDTSSFSTPRAEKTLPSYGAASEREGGAKSVAPAL